jgi:hypothetical protein
MSTPATLVSVDSRRGSVPADATKSTKKAVPRPRAIPAYESARPAISSGLGGGAAFGTGGGVGIGPFPTTNAKLPLVVWPSTALVAVQATRYPPSPIGATETRRPLGSPDGARSPLSYRLPFVSSTWISLPFGSGGSLNSIRISVGGFTRRASAFGLERR